MFGEYYVRLLSICYLLQHPYILLLDRHQKGPGNLHKVIVGGLSFKCRTLQPYSAIFLELLENPNSQLREPSS